MTAIEKTGVLTTTTALEGESVSIKCDQIDQNFLVSHTFQVVLRGTDLSSACFVCAKDLAETFSREKVG